MVDIFDLLKNCKYSDMPMYDGRYIYPNTGDANNDWEIFSAALDFLATVKIWTIEEYFYWLSFSERIFYETRMDNYRSKVLSNITFGGSANFTLTGAVGSLTPGYSLIFPRDHILSMSALEGFEREEYIKYLNKVRRMFYSIYGRVPIVFEHGSNTQDRPSSNSINHAHTHVVNFAFKDEDFVIERLKMEEVTSLEELLDRGRENNYITYISSDDRMYYTDRCEHESQLMRKFMAEDLGIPDKYNWREYPFLENIFETAKDISLHRIRRFDK